MGYLLVCYDCFCCARHLVFVCAFTCKNSKRRENGGRMAQNIKFILLVFFLLFSHFSLYAKVGLFSKLKAFLFRCHVHFKFSLFIFVVDRKCRISKTHRKFAIKNSSKTVPSRCLKFADNISNSEFVLN